ncbi:hypothetical protein [Janthinobacterium lividum]|uniref:hypothetical protein n=1 Tax=Janthinobacterium lividum TaxID=29581 RepID=UPI001596396B|nr:hypothetical protein [Janthinobacterium lividum]QKY12045.1 hypothetical protein G8765_29605 [Janthinobacterium lividum]
MKIAPNDVTTRRGRMLRVTAMAELSYLVKEREVVSGRPGRDFFVGKRRNRAFVIHAEGNGFEIRRGDSNAANEVHYVTDQQSTETVIGSALRDGKLFTPRLAD